MFIMGVIIGTLFGGALMFLPFCIIVAGGRTDWETEYWNLKEGDTKAEKRLLQKVSSKKEIPETEKNQEQILFVDTDNQELFWIEDGDCIELFSENGDRQTCLCHYLDKRHASIDGKRRELLTYARWMKKQGITYIPSTQQRREGGVVA